MNPSSSCLPWADKAAAWALQTTLSALFSPGRGAQPCKLGLLTLPIALTWLQAGMQWARPLLL